jgi:hypothetical protein
MSADFHTKHFKGWQRDGYVHVVRVDSDGQEYALGDLTAGEVAELASMFPPPALEFPSEEKMRRRRRERLEYTDRNGGWMSPQARAELARMRADGEQR